MRIPRIYTEQELTLDSQLLLEENASHHVLKVLRMQVGRQLILFNGRGGEYSAEITSINKRHAQLSIETFIDKNVQSPLKTHLAIGISRGERFDFVLQKATELGVREISPLFTERTEVKLTGDRLNKKYLSWQKITIAACEQSGRCELPKVNRPTNISDFLAHDYPGGKYVLHHRHASSMDTNHAETEVVLLVGPEGGLSEAEIKTAQENDYQALLLGPRVLRTETAPIVALTLFQHFWGDI